MSTAEPQTACDVWKPPEKRPLRHLPKLLGSSLTLLWESARTEFVLLAILQVVSGAMGGVLLFELFMLQAAAHQTGGVAPGAEVQSGS